MDYRVTLTPQAVGQIRETVWYIAKTLREPETAKHWADLLYKEIADLRFMPSRPPLTEEKPWHDRGIHKMPVKNFLVYYLIDEEAKTVSVTAVIYGRRDQIAALTNMTP